MGREVLVRNLPVTFLLKQSHITVGLGYVLAYALLNLLSSVQPTASIGITPWNPQTGLSFALILLLGRDYLPWLFIAPLVGNMIALNINLPLTDHLMAAFIIGAGYSAATSFLSKPSLEFDHTLASKRSLPLLISVGIVSAAIVAVLYVGLLVSTGAIDSSDAMLATLRLWIGDVIGIMIVTPFLLIAFTRRRFLMPSLEMAALIAFLAITLAAVFGLSDTFRVKQFYLFFLPVLWTAVRFGLEGVTTGLVLTQLGLLAAIQFSGVDANDVTPYQALMAVLAVTGLTIGTVVNEQRRTQTQLRQNQEALERAARLDTMGAFAAALAHELNQPLTAISNYARLTKMAVVKQPPDTTAASEAATHAIAQVDRAAEVMRRLRDFIQLGRNEMAPHAIPELIRETVSLCQSEPWINEVKLNIKTPRHPLLAICDNLQIQQTLINLIRNSAEAMSPHPKPNSWIEVSADLDNTNRVQITVRDNGPGFDPDIRASALTPFTTTKQQGLGLGLALAQSTAEMHGGQLLIQSTQRGTAISFTLQTYETSKDPRL